MRIKVIFVETRSECSLHSVWSRSRAVCGRSQLHSGATNSQPTTRIISVDPVPGRSPRAQGDQSVASYQLLIRIRADDKRGQRGEFRGDRPGEVILARFTPGVSTLGVETAIVDTVATDRVESERPVARSFITDWSRAEAKVRAIQA